MDLLEQLQLPLARTPDDPRSVVVMTCGIAGSGKSTLSKAIVKKHPNFVRLSIDAIQHANHGIVGKDYPKEMYEPYQDEAEAQLDATLKELLEAGTRDVVIDRALYLKEFRDHYKQIVEEKGARWVLVFFRPASKELIWKRIQGRRAAEINADSALDITPEVLDGYWSGFENPVGEGEVVVDVTGE